MSYYRKERNESLRLALQIVAGYKRVEDILNIPEEDLNRLGVLVFGNDKEYELIERVQNAAFEYVLNKLEGVEGY